MGTPLYEKTCKALEELIEKYEKVDKSTSNKSDKNISITYGDANTKASDKGLHTIIKCLDTKQKK